MKPLLTVAEVADISRTTPPTFAKAIRRGELDRLAVAGLASDLALWLGGES